MANKKTEVKENKQTKMEEVKDAKTTKGTEVKATEDAKTEVKTEETKDAKKTKKQELAEQREPKKLQSATKKAEHENLINKLVAEAMTWEGVVEKNTPDYIGLRVGKRMFAEISANTRFARILIAPILSEETEGIFDGIELEKGLRVRKAPESFGWTLRDIFELRTEEQLADMTKYLKMAYEGRLAMYKEKLQKEQEKAKKLEEKAKKLAEKQEKEKAKKQQETTEKQQETTTPQEPTKENETPQAQEQVENK